MRFRTCLATGLMLPALLMAAQSMSGGSGTTTFPNNPVLADLSKFRVEFRLHGDWNYNSPQTIYGTSAYSIRLLPSQQINITSWRDSRDCFVSLTPGTDVIVRLQRTPEQLTAEAISPQDGRSLGQLTCPLSNPGNPNDSGVGMAVGSFSGSLAYVRVFNTAVNVGTPFGNTRCAGNVADYEFEGNGNDCSSLGSNITFSGATYSTTPEWPPVATFNVWPAITSVRSGESLTLQSNAFSSTDNAALSYFWQQLSGPLQGTFTNRTAPNSSFLAPIAGNYQLQLTVKDTQGNTSVGGATFSATATDSQSVVVSQNQALDKILGPVVLMGKSPWIFGDLAETSTGAVIATAALENPPALGTALTGTVAITTGSQTIVGTGTQFVSQLAGQFQFILAWNTIDGAGTGRAVMSSWSVTDNTHITLGNGISLPTQSGLKIYLLPTVTSTFNLLWWINGYGTTFWQYYDPALAFYRLYNRTGDDVWLTRARAFADYNWTWMIDHGYGYNPPPRGAQLLSQFVRAMDGHPERLPYLAQFIAYYQNNLFFNTPNSIPNWDLREASYMMWFEAVGSQVDPDATRHAQYCTYLNNLIPSWIAGQHLPGGWWPENDYIQNPTYPYAPISLNPAVYGQSPWRMAIAVKALEATYESLVDASAQGCNNPALAGPLLNSITAAVTFLHDYGRDSQGRGIYYDVQYLTNGQVSQNGAGTVSVSLNSKTVTGLGTSFLTTFNCGADYLGFTNTRSVYKVASCQGNTSLTLDTAYGSAGETASLSGSPYVRTVASGTNCNSLATACNSPDRNLTRLVCGATGWLYHQTGNDLYRGWGDECVSATLGGPPQGPSSNSNIGSFTLPCAGPDCDGYIGDYLAALPNCSPTVPAPCTPQGGVYNFLGKNYGEAFGAPGIDNHLAWRLGGAAPLKSRTFYISFNLAHIPGAVKARVSLTQPNGTVTTQICTTSPCGVSADVRQGNHILQVVYLSATNAVLSATSDPITVKVH